MRPMSEQLQKILGTNVRRIREEMNLSQTRFALMVGLSRQMINTLECHGGNVTMKTLQRLSAGLDTPAWELLTDWDAAAGADENEQNGPCAPSPIGTRAWQKRG
jgi:transcriptional regulator with XRE-family HTH domain